MFPYEKNWNFYLVLFQGSTSVALYGLGNIRDERLNRMFQVFFWSFFFFNGSCSTFFFGNIFSFCYWDLFWSFTNLVHQTPHAVQWIRPEAQEGCDVPDWFNILVLHQNRLFFTLEKQLQTYKYCKRAKNLGKVTPNI